jgi:hypothetical protein
MSSSSVVDVRAVAQVVRQFGGVGDAAADQQPTAVAVLGGAGIRQRCHSPVIKSRPLDLVAAATPFPRRARGAGGEQVGAGTAGPGGDFLVAGHGEYVADAPATCLRANDTTSVVREFAPGHTTATS